MKNATELTPWFLHRRRGRGKRVREAKGMMRVSEGTAESIQSDISTANIMLVELIHRTAHYIKSLLKDNGVCRIICHDLNNLKYLKPFEPLWNPLEISTLIRTLEPLFFLADFVPNASCWFVDCSAVNELFCQCHPCQIRSCLMHPRRSTWRLGPKSGTQRRANITCKALHIPTRATCYFAIPRTVLYRRQLGGGRSAQK